MTEPDVLLGSPWLSHDWGVQDGSIFLHLDDAVDVWYGKGHVLKSYSFHKRCHGSVRNRAFDLIPGGVVCAK